VEACESSWRARLKQAAATADEDEGSPGTLAVVALSSPARPAAACSINASTPPRDTVGPMLVRELQTQLEAQAAEHTRALQQVHG
jgi:hypothetical protein